MIYTVSDERKVYVRKQYHVEPEHKPVNRCKKSDLLLSIWRFNVALDRIIDIFNYSDKYEHTNVNIETFQIHFLPAERNGLRACLLVNDIKSIHNRNYMCHYSCVGRPALHTL